LYLQCLRFRQPNGGEVGSDGDRSFSETGIAVAKSMFPGPTYIGGKLYELSLPVKHIDVVVCQEVIAHVEDQQKLLEQISTVLKPAVI